MKKEHLTKMGYDVSPKLSILVVNVYILYPLKTQENQTFSDVFRVYILARNGLKHIMVESLYYTKKLKNYSCKKAPSESMTCRHLRMFL